MGESSKNNRELYERTNPVFNTAKMTLFQLAQQGNTHAAEISEKMGLTVDTQKSRSFSMSPGGRDDIPDHPGDTIPYDGQSGTRIGIPRTC